MRAANTGLNIPIPAHRALNVCNKRAKLAPCDIGSALFCVTPPTLERAEDPTKLRLADFPFLRPSSGLHEEKQPSFQSRGEKKS